MPESKNRKLKILESKKQMLYQRFQRQYDYIKDLSNPKVASAFKIAMNSLEKSQVEIGEVVEEINLLNLELYPDFVPNYQVVESVNNLYCHILDAFKTLKQTSVEECDTVHSLKAQPKLPKMDLVEFSGDPKSWPIFYENFKSCVHENSELDDACKIHYLLSKLSGRALALCSGVPPVAANYESIWKILVDTFQDERLLATTYLNSILNFKPISSESAHNLNSFLEKFDVSVSALKQLKITDLADFLLVSLALAKLDSNTRRSFEMTIKGNDIPTYNQLIRFVKQQSKILDRTPVASTSSSSGGTTPKLVNKKVNYAYSNTLVSNAKIPIVACPICSDPNHTPNRCHNFLKLSPTDRYKLAREKYLCLNCLSSKHRIVSCKSKNTCNTCKSRHHSLLHFEQQLPNNSDKLSCTNNDQIPSNFVSSNSIVLPSNRKTTLLPTAEVLVSTDSGKNRKIRILLDSGSQENFITEKCCQRLDIPIHQTRMSVVGIGSHSSPVKGIARNLVFYPRFSSNIKFTIDALVLDNLTTSLPTQSIANENLKHFTNIPLADSNFNKRSEIDGILGIDIFHAILNGDKIVDPTSNLVALPTLLGYVIAGKTNKTVTVSSVDKESNSFVLLEDNSSLENLVQNFLKIEEVPETYNLSPDDFECEKHFVSTYFRNDTGRYTVSLPFKIDPVNLGDSYTTALRRFLSLEKKLVLSPNMKEQYSNIISDYLSQGHLRRIANPQTALSKDTGYIIPHHAIFKHSSSTPIRIVFDAGSKTAPNSLSLNDCLYTGPKLQSDIVRMFLNFRLSSIAMIADIRQMYRQINVSDNDQKYQRILWRFSSHDAVEMYEITRVVFGIKSSPYLALRVIHQLAKDEAGNFPIASKIVLRDMYVDDLITSVDNLDQAKLLFDQVIEFFKSGGFEITKWYTNSSDFLSYIPIEKRSVQVLDFDSDSLKVLGIQWHPKLDTLSFSIHLPLNSNKLYTKRTILSEISKIFDPLGILGPVIIYTKLFIRKLWSLKLDWDSNLPSILVNQWIQFENELPLLKGLSIPRWLGGTEDGFSVTFIGLSDASQVAYGAAVYLHIQSSHKNIVNLLCSKSKIAPLKTVSLPRLELCAAVLLSKLLKYIIDIYSGRCKIDRIFACSDSQIALSWIADSPHRWKSFVANRVSQIHDNISPDRWFFVPGEQNIADSISRGTSPSKFLSSSKEWLHGPLWMNQEVEKWPIKSLKYISHREDLPERNTISLALNTEPAENSLLNLINRTSVFSKLLYVTVYVLRFLKRLQLEYEIKVSDLQVAELYLIKAVQLNSFGDLITSLQENKPISKSFRKLCPFVDDKGIIRVGGRLSNACQIGFDFKHQILLPKNEHFVKILIDYYHKKYLHTGPYLLFSLLRHKYWILSARNLIRQRIRSCNYCFKFKPKPNFPIMANLPAPRVNPQLKPFIDTGVDYAGPFTITLTRRRGVKTQKAYICLFVCLATKNIHLELVSDLSTDAFINALKRFISRRGPVKTLYSDQGTNFIGCKRYFNELTNFIVSSKYNEALKKHLLENSISWKYNVPLAPHMGGLWESNVKSMKSHLFKCIGLQILGYEELNTVLTQIEAILNSRPLCSYNSDDPSDPAVLTPAHFTLTALDNFPSINVLHENINRLARKQLIDRLVQSYWARWKDEYLHQLQIRQKWNTTSNPVKVGTVVLVLHENTPPLQWPLGRITEIFPGNDGVVRVASVKTKFGTYKRPVIKLCPLPTQ